MSVPKVDSYIPLRKSTFFKSSNEIAYDTHRNREFSDIRKFCGLFRFSLQIPCVSFPIITTNIFQLKREKYKVEYRKFLLSNIEKNNGHQKLSNKFVEVTVQRTYSRSSLYYEILCVCVRENFQNNRFCTKTKRINHLRHSLINSKTP